MGREGQPHPLQSALLELGTLWEENEVDLAQVDECAFVEALVDSEPNRLGTAFREALCRHTGGHALFTVELLHGLEQRGDLLRDDEGRWVEGPALDWDRLPRRVEAVIAAHMARLPREQQELLSVASVEGEEFHAEVAARVLQRSETAVLAALSGPLSQEHRLVRAQSLHRLGEQRFSRYRFRHYLFQRYLYQRLDVVRRARAHGEVGNALEAWAVLSGTPQPMDAGEDLPDNYDDVFKSPEGIVSEGRMAWHWEEAGLPEKAAPYLMRAVKRASQFSLAHQEILSRVLRMLGLLATLPESPRRARQEQYGYLALGWAWVAIKGGTAPEVGQAFRKSLEIAEQIGDKLLVADALASLCGYRCTCGELRSPGVGGTCPGAGAGWAAGVGDVCSGSVGHCPSVPWRPCQGCPVAGAPLRSSALATHHPMVSACALDHVVPGLPRPGAGSGPGGAADGCAGEGQVRDRPRCQRAL